MTTSVIVADGEPLFREGLAQLLATQTDLRVVGEAADTEEAIEQAWREQPDVVLLALNLPTAGGQETARRIRQMSPGIKVIMLVPPRGDEEHPGMEDDVHGVLHSSARATQISSDPDGPRRRRSRTGPAPIALSPQHWTTWMPRRNSRRESERCWRLSLARGAIVRSRKHSAFRTARSSSTCAASCESCVPATVVRVPRVHRVAEGSYEVMNTIRTMLLVVPILASGYALLSIAALTGATVLAWDGAHLFLGGEPSHPTYTQSPSSLG